MMRTLMKAVLPISCLLWIRLLRDKCWDTWHGVQTTGWIEQSALTVLGPNASHASAYESSSPGLVKKILAKLDLDYGRYTFIDFGSGKGRVLLVASRFPFKAVVGVEFASELHRIATENLRRYRRATVQCGTIECVHQDAVNLILPPTPLVLFFFNPFSDSVMASVMRNLKRTYDVQPRDVRIICAGSWTQVDAIERLQGVKMLWREAHAVVYRLCDPVSTVAFM